MRRAALLFVVLVALFQASCTGVVKNSGGGTQGGTSGGTSGGTTGGGTSGGSGAPPAPSLSACSAMSGGQGASLNGFVPFPADNAWNQDISSAAVDPNSAAIISFIGSTVPVHPDFGSGLYSGSSIGIPYLIVDSTQGPVTINFTAYGSESDPDPMPIPTTAPIEGYPAPGNGDRHVLVLDNANCWLYELYSSYPQSDGTWNARLRRRCGT